ncbi:MAG TPA: VCBS repeat-containing protein, partial [Planctomycetota bacterium]|nr:VCBS repeat-containing protein [Planctomycetota bacterium]
MPSVPLVICALLAFCLRALAQSPPTFRELSFPAGPRIVDHVFLDLDGDGAKDLMLVRGRECSLFLQKNGGGYLPERPDQKFNFVDSAILWAHGDVDGDGRPEILFLTDEGVSYYKWENGRLSFIPKTLLAVQGASILKVASKDEIRHKDFYEDLDGDGVADLLLPGDNCFLLSRGLTGGGFRPPDRLAMRPEVWIDAGGESPTSQASSTYWYPQPVSGDFDGDGKRDIFVHQREQVSVFLQRKDGGYGPDPSLALPLEFQGDLAEGRFKLDLQLPTKFVDIDGDGLTDIVATHIGRATTYVFRGKKDRRDLKTPDAV